MTGKELYTFADGECLDFAWDTHRDIARTRRREATQVDLSLMEMKPTPCDTSQISNVKVV